MYIYIYTYAHTYMANIPSLYILLHTNPSQHSTFAVCIGTQMCDVFEYFVLQTTMKAWHSLANLFSDTSAWAGAPPQEHDHCDTSLERSPRGAPCSPPPTAAGLHSDEASILSHCDTATRLANSSSVLSVSNAVKPQTAPSPAPRIARSAMPTFVFDSVSLTCALRTTR